MVELNIVLWVALVQGGLGAFDTFFFHEWRLRLPHQPECVDEQKLHAIRDFLYAGLYLQLAFFIPHGLWAFVVLVILVAEIVITLLDFLTEDRIRRLPPGERVLHSVVAILFGVLLAYYVPFLWSRVSGPTALEFQMHGLSWLFALMAVGALGMGVRDYLAHRRLAA